jgi:UPF0176 protein
MSRLVVAALYRFTRFDAPASLRAPLRELCDRHAVKGTLLLAQEGVNGTIAGGRAGIDAVLCHIRGLPGCAGLEVRESPADEMPFARMKVRLKREIVTLGRLDADPAARVGRYVEPCDWNQLIRSSDVVVIDTRNAYETSIGTFQGAVDPQTRSFGEFPAWWRANRERFEGRKVAMFCTGGIRCEKATSYLLGEGVENVYHLRGGILKYLDEVPEPESLWQGECYVFDRRVSVGHGLARGAYGLCHACGRPVSDADRTHAAYEEGVCCLACIDEYDATDRERFRERLRQILLASARQERGRV